MINRLLAAIFGGVLFSVITPIGYFLIFKSTPLAGFFEGIFLLVGCGFAFGAALGALFPRPFGFIFEFFFDI